MEAEPRPGGRGRSCSGPCRRRCSRGRCVRGRPRVSPRATLRADQRACARASRSGPRAWSARRADVRAGPGRATATWRRRCSAQRAPQAGRRRRRLRRWRRARACGCGARARRGRRARRSRAAAAAACGRRAGRALPAEQAEAAAERMRAEPGRRAATGGRGSTLRPSRTTRRRPAWTSSSRWSAGPARGLEFAGARAARGAAQRASSELAARGRRCRPTRWRQAAERLEDAFRRAGPPRRRRDRAARRRAATGEVVRLRGGARARGARWARCGWRPRRRDGLARRSPRARARRSRTRVLAEDARALQRALEDARLRRRPAWSRRCPEAAGDLPVVFRVRPGPRTVVAAVRVEARRAAARRRRAARAAPARGRALPPARPRPRPRQRCSPPTATPATRRRRWRPRSTRPSDRRARPTSSCACARAPRVRVDHVVIAGLSARARTVVRRELLAARRASRWACEQVLESQRRLGALGIFERVSLSELDPETPGARSAARGRGGGAAHHGGLRRRLRRAGPAARQRGGDAPQPVRHGPQPLHLRARELPRAAASWPPSASPTSWAAGRSCSSPASARRRTATVFDFVRCGRPRCRRRARSRAALEPDRALHLPADAHASTSSNPDEVDREFRTSTLSGPVGLAWCTTRATTPSTRAAAASSAPTSSSPHALLGGDSFVKGFLQAATYQRLHRAHGARPLRAPGPRPAPSATSGSLLLPRPDRFYAGGDYSLRGFDLDSRALPLGRQRPAAGRGGAARGRRPLLLGRPPSRDAGNVYPLVSDLTLGDLRYTAGPGPALPQRARPPARGLGLQARPPPGRERLPPPLHDRPCVLDARRPAVALRLLAAPAVAQATWWSGSWPWWTAARVLLSEVRLVQAVRGLDRAPRPWRR